MDQLIDLIDLKEVLQYQIPLPVQYMIKTTSPTVLPKALQWSWRSQA
uniref:Uncharacterized protein n=1 Tax=Arundo donax TaxID=35708 RepID=A0A0A9APK6_ARUDO